MSDPANQVPADFQNQAIEDNRGKFRSGANWFYWIAGLSIVNSISVYAGTDWVFIIGLGITQLTDSTAMQLAEIYPEEGNYFKTLSLVVDLLASVVFLVFGWLSNRRNSIAYVTGMALYLGDGLIFLLVEDWTSIGFHVLALFFMVSGYTALRNLLEQESIGQSGKPGIGLASPLLWVNMAMILAVAIISFEMITFTTAPLIVTDISSSEELDAYTAYYYETRQSGLISRSMEFIDSSNLVDDESTHSSIVGFYSEVFRQNPDEIWAWIDTIDGMENVDSRRVFWKALWMANLTAGTEYFRSKIENEKVEAIEELNSYLSSAPPVPVNLTPEVPGELDLQWGAFFASGDVKYVDNIIDAALLYNQRIDPDIFYTAALAKWSLCSNSLHHEPVSAALIARREDSDTSATTILQDILNKSALPYGPQMIIEDANLVIEAEVAAGRWSQEP